MAEPPEPAGPRAVGSSDVPADLRSLAWSPSWRDRLGALAGASPGRLAALGVALVLAAAVIATTVLRQPAPLPELTMPVAGGVGDPAASTTTTTSASTAPPTEVVVHAAGAVASPGVYRLAEGSRVADLLAAAGGPSEAADLDRLNLAALLADGERVFVPLPGQEVPVVSGSAATTAGAAGHDPPAGEPVDLNAATLADLDTLPGVGPATAQAILDERERRGRFTSVEELLDVRGIGEAKLAALRDLVRV